MNKGKDVVEKMVKDIHRHLEKGGHFISIEEYPLRIGFEQDPINRYIQENTEQIDLEGKLYPLIRSKEFVDAEDTICYDIDTQQRLLLMKSYAPGVKYVLTAALLTPLKSLTCLKL
ncbi:hypothetical protein HZC30_07195 [Candidatus Woesearchaeota archaeon]|nr:hypothetical protein [Candidatus Woesearchaeota archaeon]